MANGRQTVFIGSGTWGSDIGRIQVFSLDIGEAKLELVQEVATGGIMSFMARSPDGSRLYVADEGNARLSCYAVAPDTGRLDLLHQAPCAGHPVYLSLDVGRQALLTCFFGEGKTQLFRLASDGALGAPADPVDSGRESHCAVFTPDQRHVLVPCRGDNWIAQYRYGSEEQSLVPNEPPHIGASAGAGPRHLVFHPNGRWVYVVNELSRSLSFYELEAERGTLRRMADDISTTPSGVTDGDAADIHVHPGGRFLFVSNRQGDRSNIAVFAVDERSGQPLLLGHEPTRGKTPRNFALDPEGNWLLVANQESDNVALFSVDARSGALGFLRSMAVAPSPCFVGT